MLRNILLLFAFLFPLFLFSQNKITGQILDSENIPVEFATINLHTKDTVLLKSTFSDENGKFEIDEIQGNYLLDISFLGNPLFNKEIKLNNNIDLGIIKVENSITLQEIIISKEKKLIEKKIDRLVFNVENSVAATGGNGLDALKLAPRIKVQNDEISMIGKGSVAVLINDRIVQMSGEDLSTYLKSLNAEDIKSIEVISNPPAKYSAEGNSGLVNIVLKKSKNDAWNASLRSIYQQATYAKGNVGGSFNMQKGKIQLNTAISYTNGSNAPQETNKIFYPNLTWDEVNNRRDFTDALSTRLGLEYKINDKLSTGFTYNYINSNPLIKEIDKTTLTNPSNSVLDSLITTLGRNEYDKTLNSLNYHLIYDIDTIGRKLSLDFDYFNYKNETNRIFNTQSFFPNSKFNK